MEGTGFSRAVDAERPEAAGAFEISKDRQRAAPALNRVAPQAPRSSMEWLLRESIQ